MKRIRLTQGKYALVDAIDYTKLARLRWHAHKEKSGLWYALAYRIGSGRGGKGVVRMHRVITNCPKTLEVNHKNGNGLDNRRANLEVCTHKENLQRRAHTPKNNTSGIVGVYWHGRSKKWMAAVGRDGKSVYIGIYKTKEAAARARRGFAKH